MQKQIDECGKVLNDKFEEFDHALIVLCAHDRCQRQPS
jgi:hypothetical protein